MSAPQPSAIDFGKLIDDTGEMLPRISEMLGHVSGLMCAAFQRGLGDAAHCQRVAIAFTEAGQPRLYFQLELPDGRGMCVCEPLLGLDQSVMPEVVERGAITATSLKVGLLPVPIRKRVPPTNGSGGVRKDG